jgi:hypothetical protein
MLFVLTATILSACALPLFCQESSTVCQAQPGASYCSDTPPGPADSAGYHDMGWVNLNKALSSISVSDDKVWGLDAAGTLWYLSNFKTSTTWIKVASGVSQISAGHNLLCQINSNGHVYCSTSPNPAAASPDANGFQSLQWFDAGATNFKQIAVSAGNQIWAVDANSNLVQVADYTNLAATSKNVASGILQVAVDGRGLLCELAANNNSVFCTNWPVPPASSSGGYYSLNSWYAVGTQMQNIAVADGQVWSTDASGYVWLLPDYTNSNTWYKVAFGQVGDVLSAASVPSTFTPSTFASDEVAVMLFMGQSNAVGINSIPTRFVAQASPNVLGVQNAGWNYLPGNVNGTTPFNNTISSIQSIQWQNWSIVSGGTDMNLGFTSTTGGGGNAADFAAYEWQAMINAGAQLPNLYIIDIGWPSQGVDAQDTYSGTSEPWVAHGVNLWQPTLTSSQIPSYALAPFARTIVYDALTNILASGKKPRILGLQWNQWEAEAGNANTVSITDAPTNYTNLVNNFYTAVGSHFPIVFIKPLSTAYGTTALSEMQQVFANLASNDPTDISVLDISTVSSTIFSGGVLGGGDGSVHYNLDTHLWFANQAIGICLTTNQCGSRLTSVPATAPN